MHQNCVMGRCANLHIHILLHQKVKKKDSETIHQALTQAAIEAAKAAVIVLTEGIEGAEDSPQAQGKPA